LSFYIIALEAIIDAATRAWRNDNRMISGLIESAVGEVNAARGIWARSQTRLSSGVATIQIWRKSRGDKKARPDV
jgi:hypothetical protein